jgi:hypothetical protein
VATEPVSIAITSMTALKKDDKPVMVAIILLMANDSV